MCKFHFGNIFSSIIGIIAAFIAVLLFRRGIIATIAIPLWITFAIGIAVAVLFVFFTLYNKRQCFCRSGGALLFGAIGSIVSAFIALSITLTTAFYSLFIIALVAFFFVFTLLTLLSFFTCLLDHTCHHRDNCLTDSADKH